MVTEVKNIFETNITTDREFVKLALSLGMPINSRKGAGLIDVLNSYKPEQVNKDSLSKRYGLNKFPVHTDCAYLKIPPKYILLRYTGSIVNPTPTVLIHFDISRLSDDELDFVKTKVWFVKNQNNGFYSSILEKDILRYDKEVMKMVNPSEDKLDTILVKMDTSQINWHKDKVAVINNYSVLHYRPKISEKEKNCRILQRINII
jgi:hypothetical protein